jgi:hypothetical protein
MQGVISPMPSPAEEKEELFMPSAITELWREKAEAFDWLETNRSISVGMTGHYGDLDGWQVTVCVAGTPKGSGSSLLKAVQAARESEVTGK